MRNALIIALIAAAPQAVLAEAPRVYHVPTVESPTGQSIEVFAEVDRGWQANLEVRFRRIGDTRGWHRAPFERRTDTRYQAEIPALDVAPPGVEYYIASFTDDAETAHFASADSPHPVAVREDEDILLVEKELERFEQRRASFNVSSEYVDFGKRKNGDVFVNDRYYRLEADFTYRLFRFPLRAFRLGFTQMLGDTPVTARGVEDCPADCEDEAGFRAGGWAELRWRLAEFVDVDTRVLIQATPDGFGFGARGELRFGDETATHFSLGGEGIAEVGTSFFVRLGWNTVPRFPMSATVELTDYPSAHRDHGIRLVYGIAREFGYGLRVGARVGYQARDQNIGGASGGLNATLDF